MPQLRVTLLVLGALFIAGLAVWELRRSRLARRHEPHAGAERSAGGPPSLGGAPLGHPQGAREPTISLPELSAREPERELPLVEVVDDAALLGITVEDDRDAELAEQTTGIAATDDPVPTTLDPQAAFAPQARFSAAPAREGPSAPIVAWPDESVRRIVALRVIAPGERFAGRSVRQALAAEGFVLGKFAIFHRAGPDGRAVVSAASLTKPGTFDPDSIDMQRFGGLNLFAVLPGPLPGPHAFDELLAAARGLSNRLEGALQDERGEPLTPLRAAALRETLAAQAEHDG
ncbi:MAG TPA: cell division protein ZipA C-terminal FtsZ-binding domain-containing protein [Steroidobacteraceae bacterium]|nr:cell division protein ZipA C-terminal FtsZ-binding domain-containing protein [Steroidobacteraceae bacterium]